MFRKIGNFLAKDDGDEFSLHYSLSLKDWIDFLIHLLISLIFLIITAGLLYSVDRKSDFKELISVGIVFALGLFLLCEGLSKVVRVKKNIIRIIKKENQLIHRNTLFSSKKYKLSDIERFVFLEKEQHAFGTTKKVSCIYNIIQLELKNSKTQYLLKINTNNIKRVVWKRNGSLLNIELGSITENIVKELNRNK
ncbi:hypothetical protein [Chryseobacterium taiwanense]|nr:hypothetical protein [Chryseobacterium taiwanense]